MDILHTLGTLGFVELVAFCHNDDEIIVCRLHETHHIKVVLCHRMTHIRQLNDKANVSVGGEVALHEVSPTLFLVEIYLCIAVAGQVNQLYSVAVEEVDRDRLARNGADSRKILPVKNLIEHGRFADI